MHTHHQTPTSTIYRAAPLALALLLGACASTTPDASSALPDTLACRLPSNCVSSLDGAPPPLLFAGTPAQAMDRLRTTLASFPQARIVRAETLGLEAVFITPAGFQDRVDFRIDPSQQRIDYRSRSTLGLCDFGKNGSRMALFATRFAATPGR
jgi:uncharacterized protein (DUF1499 family)